MYSIVIQLGAILCLPIYFRNRIWDFLKTFPRGEHGDRTALTHPLTLVMAAFFVTAIPSYLLHKVIGKNLESLVVMGAALFIGGAVMWAVDFIFGARASGGTTGRMPADFAEAGAGTSHARGKGKPVDGLAAALNPD